MVDVNDSNWRLGRDKGTCSKHGLLGGEFHELGPELIASFRGEELINDALALVQSTGYSTLKGTGHAADEFRHVARCRC